MIDLVLQYKFENMENKKLETPQRYTVEKIKHALSNMEFYARNSNSVNVQSSMNNIDGFQTPRSIIFKVMCEPVRYAITLSHWFLKFDNV